jgi:hypothetical protein
VSRGKTRLKLCALESQIWEHSQKFLHVPKKCRIFPKMSHFSKNVACAQKIQMFPSFLERSRLFPNLFTCSQLFQAFPKCSQKLKIKKSLCFHKNLHDFKENSDSRVNAMLMSDNNNIVSNLNLAKIFCCLK